MLLHGELSVEQKRQGEGLGIAFIRFLSSAVSWPETSPTDRRTVWACRHASRTMRTPSVFVAFNCSRRDAHQSRTSDIGRRSDFSPRRLLVPWRRSLGALMSSSTTFFLIRPLVLCYWKFRFPQFIWHSHFPLPFQRPSECPWSIVNATSTTNWESVHITSNYPLGLPHSLTVTFLRGCSSRTLVVHRDIHWLTMLLIGYTHIFCCTDFT